MANGEEENQNQEDPFADLEASITDSFSRLQESVDRHAERMGEIQDSAGDTLLSSDFMNSLNDKLEQISEDNDQIIEQQEALKSEFEQLNANISSLNTSLSELQQSISSFTLEADVSAEVDSSELSFLTESFTQSADRIAQSISSEILSLSEDITRTYSTLQAGSDIGPELIYEVSDNIAKSLSVSIQENVDSLRSDVLTGIELLQLTIEESFESAGFDQFNQAILVVEGRLNQFINELSELRGGLSTEISSVRESIFGIDSTLNSLMESLNQSVNQFVQFLSSEIGSLSDRLINAYRVSQTGSTITPDLLFQVSNSITSVISNRLDELSSEYFTGIELLELSIGENLENLRLELLQIDEGINDLSGTLSSIESKIVSSIHSLAETVVSDISSQISSFADELTNLTTPIQGGEEITSDLLLQVSSSLIENLREEIRDSVESFKSFYLEGINQISSSFEEGFDSLELSPFGRSLSNMESRLAEIQDVNNQIKRIISERISSLGEAISSAEVETGEEINYEAIKNAVINGVTTAFQQQMITQQQVAQRGQRGQMRDRPNEPQRGRTQNINTSINLPTTNFGNINIPTFAGGQGLPQISNLLTGNVSLNEDFPEFLADLEAQNESLSNTIKVTNDELENFDDIASKVVESGKRLKEINLGDVLGGQLIEGSEEYNRIMGALLDEFKDVIGERGEQLVQTTRNIIHKSQERLRYEQVMPDNFLGIIDRGLGYDDVYQRLSSMAQGIEDEFINAAANINDIPLAQEFETEISAVGLQIHEMQERVKELSEDSTIMEIKAELEPDLVEGTEELRNQSEEFRRAQEEMITESIKEVISGGSTAIEDVFNEVTGELSKDIAQGMNQQIAGSADKMFQTYAQLEQQGASVVEIQNALEDVTEQIKEETEEWRNNSEEFENLQDDMLENLLKEITAVEKVKQSRKATNEIYQRYFGMLQTVQNRYEEMQTLISGIGEALSSPRMWGFAALNGVLALAYQVYDQILDIDESLRGVADSTGLVRSQLGRVRNVIMDIQGPLMARGATLQEIAKSAGLIFSELQGAAVTTERLGMGTEALASAIGEVSTGFNVSMEAAAGMLSSMQAITGATGQALRDTMIMTQELATQREVAPQAVFNDISEASEEIAKFGEINARNIANAAVNARELGTNLNEVLGIAEGFRNNIVGSLQSLQQAELMLGQPIPAERLVSASFESPEAFTRELRNTMQQLDLDLDGPLATFRLQSLSDAFGVSVMRLRRMAESAQAAEEALGSLPAGERIGVLNDKIAASQTRFEAVTNRVTGFGKALLNLIAQPILNSITPILGDLSLLLRNIMEEFTGLMDIYEGIEGKSLKFAEAVKVAKGEISEFGEGATGTRAKTASLAHSFISFAESAYEVGKTLVGLTGDIVKITEAVLPLFEAVGSVIESFESLGETLGIGGTGGVLVGLASLYGGFRGISAIISRAVVPALSGVLGPAISAVGRKIGSMIPWTTTLGSTLSGTTSTMSTAAGTASSAASVFGSFGAQALMVAGAVYTIAESFETFASLSWDEMKKGIAGVSTALIGLTGAVAAVQLAVSTFSASAVQMAAAGGVLLSFAGAVWILSDAMGAFANAGMEGVKAMAASLTVITAFGAGIATLIGATGGTAAAAGLAAAGVLGAFGLALKLVGSAILDFAESAQMIGSALETINQLENVDQLAGKIRDLGNALASMPDISLGNIFAGMVGEGVADQLQMLVELGRQAQPLDNVANSVNRIADALQRLEGVEVSGTLSQIDEITSTSFTEGAGNFLTSIGTAVSEMFSIDKEPQPTTQTRMGQQETVNTQTGQAQTPTVDPYQNLDEEELGTEDQSYTNQMLQNEEQMINLLQEIAESENALLSALRNGEVAVYMDGDDVTDTVFKKANQRNSRR